MSTRITQSTLARTLLADLGQTSGALARTQQKLSSGKELTRPSDDPFSVSRALRYRAEIAENQQHQRNVSDATAWNRVTDDALSSVGDYVLRARELLIQGSSDSASPQARAAIAAEIGQLIEGVKSAVTVQYAGRYVFSGSATLTAPYQSGPSDAYAGDTAALQREIGPGIRIDVNTTGSSVVGDSSTGLLKTLRDIVTDLGAGNGNALRTTDIQAIDAAHDTILNARAAVGARTNRLETASDRLGQLEETATKLLSETEDADIAKTMVEFSQQQASYQAALKAGAQIIQLSLVDFLR